MYTLICGMCSLVLSSRQLEHKSSAHRFQEKLATGINNNTFAWKWRNTGRAKYIGSGAITGFLGITTCTCYHNHGDDITQVCMKLSLSNNLCFVNHVLQKSHCIRKCHQMDLTWKACRKQWSKRGGSNHECLITIFYSNLVYFFLIKQVWKMPAY